MNEETTVIAQRYRQLMLAVDKEAVSKRYAHESIYETALRFIKERVKQEIEDQKDKTVDKNKHSDWRDKLNHQKR